MTELTFSDHQILIRSSLWTYFCTFNYRYEQRCNLIEVLDKALMNVSRSDEHLDVSYLLQFNLVFENLNFLFFHLVCLTKDKVA